MIHLLTAPLLAWLVAQPAIGTVPLTRLLERCGEQYAVCVQIGCESLAQNALYLHCSQLCLAKYQQCAQDAKQLEEDM